MSVKVNEPHLPDDIVISGISGMFPASENIEEFKNNLFDGIDMTSAVRTWDRSEAIRRMGLMKNIDHFDHDFFHMDRQQAARMSPYNRLLLERVFEAILDAGYNLQQIKGKNIAVVCGIFEGFMGESHVKKDGDDTSPLKSKHEPSNIISYWFDIHGPSITVYAACSTSLYAMDYALKAIQHEECDSALVCSANLCKMPADQSFKLGMFSPTGISRPFDENGDGFTRAEAAVAVFLQKRKDARRTYATFMHSHTNCDGFKPEGITYPSISMQKKLYADFYKEININPSKIYFVEAHGTSTKVGDAVEGSSLEEFFCANRETPLKMGSVKSNMGHAEGASGLCSVAKMLLSFEEGMIPPYFNFTNPNKKIKGLHNGKLEIITKPLPVEGKYFAINSFGIGGANSHILISPHNKIKKRDHESTNSDLPRLVAVTSRTEEGLNCILNQLEKNHTDLEYVGLMHEIFSESIEGYFHRGFIILNQGGNHIRSKKLLSDEKPPLWFIFSGMGSQWPAMGTSLMKIPIFADSICKSNKVLQTKGVDLFKIITSNDPQIIRNVLNSYVGIVAIQIGLVDVLKALGITPDGMLGHSIGEISCAYADECLTAEQTILIAYYYGMVSLEAEFIPSMMVVVGQNYNLLKSQLPPEIDITSHDSTDCCTISGPADAMQEFVEELSKKNIAFQEVHTSDIAYHNRYITSAPSKLTSYFKKYFTNNFLSPAYFEETYNHIPNHAYALEIAPYGYLNDILKLSPNSAAQIIPLTMKSCENKVNFFLNALGRLHEMGFNLKLSNLYPLIEFPVSKSTPMISPSIKWQHNERLDRESAKKKNFLSTVRNVEVNVKIGRYGHILGHVIDERNLYPGFGYLELIWCTVASMLEKELNTLSIVFENVRFERATNVPKKGTIKFCISVHLGTNTFGITENGALVASGKVRVPKKINHEVFDMEPFEDEISNSHILPLNTKDFYKELRLKGYHYNGMFKKVVYANAEGTYGKVLWGDNFTTFMDTMAQITAVHADCRQLLVPTFIRKLVIDVNKHYRILQTLDKETPEYPVNFYPELSLLNSGGVQMLGFRANEIARRPDKADPVLETYKFIPYISEEEMNLSLAVRLCVHIALENLYSVKVKTYELLDQEYSKEVVSISNNIANTLADLPLIQASVYVLTQSKNVDNDECPRGVEISNEDLPDDNSSLLIVLSNIRSKTNLFENVFKALREDGFIIAKESRCEKISFEDIGFNTCFSRKINADEKIILLRKIKETKSCSKAIRIRNDSYSWISEIQTTLTDEEHKKFVVYAEKDEISGILGFFNCLRKEEKGAAARCFFIQDQTAPEFSLDDLFYKPQLDKNLAQNVFKHGKWGSYRHLPLELQTQIETLSAFCSLEKRADLSSFTWFEDSIDPTNHKNSNEKSLIHVYYSSLNFRDVMLSVGRISDSDCSTGYSRFNEGYQGTEYSGKDVNGQRLMGIVITKGLSTTIETQPMFTWVVPHNMSLEEAASIPIIYSTVIYALFFRIELKKGSSVLIHAGAGGIGQAAINICLQYECNIFTTVGTPEKIAFIRKTYPQIPENHICNSRDTSFEKVIIEETNGRGVDVVLNSLSEEKLKASLRCCAKGGHFLEIGKFDMARNNDIEMGLFLKDITLHSIQLDVSMKNQNLFLSKGIKEKVQELLDQGTIKPITRTVFESDAVQSAFRYMAAGKHIGKVIIKIRDEEGDLQSKPVSIRMKAKPRVFCKEDASYILVGGLGGFGLELADWLILRGARNMVINSRTGVRNGYQSYRIKLWRSYGVNIIISTDDVTNEDGVRNLLQTANSMGPIKGIFNVAVILNDGPFQKQTNETFNTVAGPKAIATIHLDKLSREICPHIEHFVVFSSISCGRGNSNQTNYGFANSIMERICESRKANNLPALAVQWGTIGEVGIVADFAEDNLNIAIGGTLQQNVNSCLNSLNLFMKQPNPIVGSMIVAEKRNADSDIINTIANILGIKNLKTISLTWTLPELGMDSLIGVEIKQILESEFNMFFTPEDLQTMTFEKLYKLQKDKQIEITSGKKENTQYAQLSMDYKLIKEPVIRIPLDNAKRKQIPASKNTTLFVFPGVEGLAPFMDRLTKHLPLDIFCFQYYQDGFPVQSLSNLGEYFVKFILEELDPGQEFCILGYSLGGVYATESVDLLERKGRKGYLWLIDTSPTFTMDMTVKCRHNKNKSLNEDTALENYLCTLTLKSLSPEISTEEYFSYIEKADNWEAKKKILLSITSHTAFKKDLVNSILDNLYTLIKSFSDYEFHYKALETPCTLIRQVDNPHGLNESYGLNEYFKNPVQVHQIEASHYTILEHPKTADIIMDSPIWK